MSRVENLLTETLRDPERALPSWVDPVGRVRRARAAQRRRRLTAAGGALALVAVTAVVVPMLREDEQRGTGPTGITEQQPVAVVSGRFTPPLSPVALTSVTVSDGVVYAVSRPDPAAGRPNVWRVADVEGRLVGTHISKDDGVDYPGTTRPDDPVYDYLTKLVSVGDGFRAIGVGHETSPTLVVMSRVYDLRPHSAGGADAGTPLDLLATTEGVFSSYRAPDGALVVQGSYPRKQTLQRNGAEGELAYDGTHLWVRVTDISASGNPDGSSLVRLDSKTLEITGRVKLPGSLTSGAITAGEGKVWAAVASTSAVMTTSGGVVSVDSESFEVGEMVDTLFPLELDYAEGNLWIRGQGLARLDVESGELRGAPLDLGGVAEAPYEIVVDGRYVWIAGNDGLTRLDWRYDEPRSSSS